MNITEPTPEMVELLRRCGSQDPMVAMAAQRELTSSIALELPLKRGVLKGDNLADIFERTYFPPGMTPEYPLDFVTPTNVHEFVAYVVPWVGRIPEKRVEGDRVMVPTYRVAGAIDWDLRYSENARWDIVRRAIEVLLGQFVVKMNNDGWHVILRAAADRNLQVYDEAATAGLFTKRLVALMKTVMRRNAGGNATSLGQGRLTDLYMSPEALEDMRSWDLTQADDITRREIFLAGGDESALSTVFGVRLHMLDELGEGQPYQTYFESTLAGTMSSDKEEIVVGLDLANRDSFVMPIRKDVQLFEDPTLHRSNRAGMYGHTEFGVAALSAYRCLLGSL